MNTFMENITNTADEMINKNLIMDMTEKQIIDLVYEDELFVRTMTSVCPTSFLTCC